MNTFIPGGGLTHYSNTNVDYNSAVQILRNNHWTQPNSLVWEAPNGGPQFINDSSLAADPKRVMANFGFDWDDEMKKLNTAWGILAMPSNGFSTGIPIKSDSGLKENEFRLEPWSPYPQVPKECSHDWTRYNGLNEAFTFCRKCDKKQ